MLSIPARDRTVMVCSGSIGAGSNSLESRQTSLDVFVLAQSHPRRPHVYRLVRRTASEVLHRCRRRETATVRWNFQIHPIRYFLRINTILLPTRHCKVFQSSLDKLQKIYPSDQRHITLHKRPHYKPPSATIVNLSLPSKSQPPLNSIQLGAHPGTKHQSR